MNTPVTGKFSDPVNKDQMGEALAKSPGLKFDAGKPMLSLLSRIWLEGTARVLTFGAKKYAAHNWRKGMQHSRLLDALQRHVLAFQDGEELDPESGLPHLDHASCCLMFLRENHELRRECDDRHVDQNRIARAEKAEASKQMEARQAEIARIQDSLARTCSPELFERLMHETVVFYSGKSGRV